MATHATSHVLEDLIDSVAEPGAIHPAFARHVAALLRSFLDPIDAR